MVIDELENQILAVNKLISTANFSVSKNFAPDFAPLEEAITKFNDLLAQAGADKAKSYSYIIETWSSELRNISNTLSVAMDNLKVDFNNFQNQGKAINAYNFTKKIQ